MTCGFICFWSGTLQLRWQIKNDPFENMQCVQVRPMAQVIKCYSAGLWLQ